MNKGGKFLKKLWCCVGGEYYKMIWVSPSSERIGKVGSTKEVPG